jgi:hypothetical protein
MYCNVCPRGMLCDHALHCKIVEIDTKAAEAMKFEGELIGRDPLLQQIIDWSKATQSEKVWLIIGAAGTGKSSISVGLARALRDKRFGDQVELFHHHICIYQQESTTVDYFLNQIRTIGRIPHLSDAKDDLFQLFASLNEQKQENPNHIKLLLIDGLDEAPELRNLLLTREVLSVIPSWLRIIATSRPFDDDNRLPLTKVIRLDSKDQFDAVRAFVNAKLPPLLIRKTDESEIKHDERVAELCHSLSDASSGSFIYASLILKAIGSGEIDASLSGLSKAALPRYAALLFVG